MTASTWKPADTVVSYRVTPTGRHHWLWEIFEEEDIFILEHGEFIGSKGGAISIAIQRARDWSIKIKLGRKGPISLAQ